MSHNHLSTHKFHFSILNQLAEFIFSLPKLMHQADGEDSMMLNTKSKEEIFNFGGNFLKSMTRNLKPSKNSLKMMEMMRIMKRHTGALHQKIINHKKTQMRKNPKCRKNRRRQRRRTIKRRTKTKQQNQKTSSEKGGWFNKAKGFVKSFF